MKKLITIIALLATAAIGCKKSSNNPVPSTTNPPVNTIDSPAKTDVNNLIVTISKVNTPVASHSAGNGYLWFEALNGAIYFGSASNSGGAPVQYFDKYDIATNTFKALDTDKNICACGYMSAMVGDRNGTIYYFANDATKYSVADDKWIKMPFAANVSNNHGESGAVYLNNKIYYIGGRTPSTTVKYYDIQTSSWFYAADFPYATNMCDGIAAGNRMYVFGGTNGKNKFSVYDQQANTWVEKAPLPFEMSGYYGRHMVATVNNYIYVLNNRKIYIYDIMNDKWGTNPVSVPVSLGSDNLFSSNGKLYYTGTNNSYDFQLYEAVVTIK